MLQQDKIISIISTSILTASLILIVLAFLGLFQKASARDYVCDNWSSFRLYRILENKELFNDLVEIYEQLCVGPSYVPEYENP